MLCGRNCCCSSRAEITHTSHPSQTESWTSPAAGDMKGTLHSSRSGMPRQNSCSLWLACPSPTLKIRLIHSFFLTSARPGASSFHSAIPRLERAAGGCGDPLSGTPCRIRANLRPEALHKHRAGSPRRRIFDGKQAVAHCFGRALTGAGRLPWNPEGSRRATRTVFDNPAETWSDVSAPLRAS